MKKDFLCGYRKSNHVKNKYNDLITQGKVSKDIEKLNDQILSLQDSIETYDITFSDADEFHYTKQDLQTILEERETQLKILQKNMPTK